MHYNGEIKQRHVHTFTHFIYTWYKDSHCGKLPWIFLIENFFLRPAIHRQLWQKYGTLHVYQLLLVPRENYMYWKSKHSVLGCWLTSTMPGVNARYFFARSFCQANPNIEFIFKSALILQSDWQNGVVIKTYIARLISLPASCVFYFTHQVCLRINALSHTRSRKYRKYSASSSHIQLGLLSRWIWDAEALYFSVFHSRLCNNLY